MPQFSPPAGRIDPWLPLAAHTGRSKLRPPRGSPREPRETDSPLGHLPCAPKDRSSDGRIAIMRWIYCVAALAGFWALAGPAAAYQPAPCAPDVVSVVSGHPGLSWTGVYDAAHLRPRADLLRIGLLLLPPCLGQLLPAQATLLSYPLRGRGPGVRQRPAGRLRLPVDRLKCKIGSRRRTAVADISSIDLPGGRDTRCPVSGSRSRYADGSVYLDLFLWPLRPSRPPFPLPPGAQPGNSGASRVRAPARGRGHHPPPVSKAAGDSARRRKCCVLSRSKKAPAEPVRPRDQLFVRGGFAPPCLRAGHRSRRRCRDAGSRVAHWRTPCGGATPTQR